MVTLRGDTVVDITSRDAPTIHDLMELDHAAGAVVGAAGTEMGAPSDLCADKGMRFLTRATCRRSRLPA